jgi:hypothetical protein
MIMKRNSATFHLHGVALYVTMIRVTIIRSNSVCTVLRTSYVVEPYVLTPQEDAKKTHGHRRPRSWQHGNNGPGGGP